MNDTLSDKIRQVIRDAHPQALTVQKIIDRLPPDCNESSVTSILWQMRKRQEFICVSEGTRIAYKLKPIPSPSNVHNPIYSDSGKTVIIAPEKLPEPERVRELPPKAPPIDVGQPRTEMKALADGIKRARGMLEEMAAATETALQASIDQLPNPEAFRKLLWARDQGRDLIAQWGDKRGHP